MPIYSMDELRIMHKHKYKQFVHVAYKTYSGTRINKTRKAYERIKSKRRNRKREKNMQHLTTDLSNRDRLKH